MQETRESRRAPLPGNAPFSRDVLYLKLIPKDPFSLHKTFCTSIPYMRPEQRGIQLPQYADINVCESSHWV